MIVCFLPSALVLSTLTSYTMAAAVNEIAKPGCQDECGGVKIPFPFGIGDGDACYISSLRIKCDTTTNPNRPVPLLDMSNRELLNINLEDHTIRISSTVAYKCYSKGELVPSTTTTPNSNSTYYKLDEMVPFTISGTRNRFVAMGCDTSALVWDDQSQSSNVSHVVGCTTTCNSLELVRNGTCSSSLGCCDTFIFNSMFVPYVSVDTSNNHSDKQYNNPCSYAFVAEVGSYNFSVANLSATATDCDKMRVPVVYDWSVMLSENCSEAMKDGDGNMICGSNTQCVDQDIDYGYRCQCSKGYAGNPYLPQGCQDINECVDKKLNDCQRPECCLNKNGGYACHCPDGHLGNGTTTSPCFPAPTATKLILGLSIGMGLMFGIIMLYCLYKLFKRRKKIQEREHNFKKNGGLLLEQQMFTNEGAIDRTKIFSQSELEKATDNFNENRVLGQGGQGTVYKGMLADGTIVAVKKSKKVDENQLAQFINEVAILSQINHRNVVKLFGCCLETEVPLLVYEFVPNGTLYHHIQHPSEDFQMNWKVRLQIATECAGAVAYLHSSCSTPIYHRDIKSSNILLDEKYKAKISDFGTSKTVSIDKTHVTTCVQGTFGYLDPEFFQSSQFSDKSDVYSFGVVLLELLTSKKPIFTNSSRETRGLASEFLQVIETHPKDLRNILDTRVLQHCSKEETEALALLIEKCLSLNGKQRPTMREVAMTLETIKSQYEDENVATAQGDRSQDGRVRIDQLSVTKEGPCNPSISSSFSDTSYFVDDYPLLFDSN